MKIAIIGPGAVGCLLAVYLARAGEDVCLLDYRLERLTRLRQQGISLQTPEGERHLTPVPLALSPDMGAVDLVIMAVKAHQTAVAAQALPRLLAAGGMALTLQNGLGNLEEMARVAGPARLLAGVAFLGATRQAEGHVIHAGKGDFFIGPGPGSQVSLAEIANIVMRFNRAGLECQARDDIEMLLWEKLLVNVGINPLTAILRVPNGALVELPEAWELAVTAAVEAQAVAQAAGLYLSGAPEARLRRVCVATAANRSSMLQDILAGRPTEIEALNAQVVSRGAALGVPTPINDLLTRLLRALEQAARFRVG